MLSGRRRAFSQPETRKILIHWKEKDFGIDPSLLIIYSANSQKKVSPNFTVLLLQHIIDKFRNDFDSSFLPSKKKVFDLYITPEIQKICSNNITELSAMTFQAAASLSPQQKV